MFYILRSVLLSFTHPEGWGLCLKIDQLWLLSYPPPKIPASSNQHFIQFVSTRTLSDVFIRETFGKIIIFLLVLGVKNKNPEVPEVLVLRNNQIGRIKSTLGKKLNLFDFTDVL